MGGVFCRLKLRCFKGWGDQGRDAGLGRTAGGPAVLVFFDWASKLPNFQKKMAATSANL